jgi:hypothetical protein
MVLRNANVKELSSRVVTVTSSQKVVTMWTIHAGAASWLLH